MWGVGVVEAVNEEHTHTPESHLLSQLVLEAKTVGVVILDHSADVSGLVLETFIGNKIWLWKTYTCWWTSPVHVHRKQDLFIKKLHMLVDFS